MAPETSTPWSELRSKVPYQGFASFFTKHYAVITDQVEVTVTVEYRKKGSKKEPYRFKFTPVASSTNGSVKGPLLDFFLHVYSAFGCADWEYFNKFCIRFKGIIDSVILEKETEELELALRQRKLKQQEADALMAVHTNVFNNSLPMDDPFDNAGGSDESDDERTIITADNSSRKQRRGSCEPQSSGSRKQRRGSCEPQDSGSAGKRRREEASDSDPEEEDERKAERKKRKAPKTSFAAAAFGAAASMFGVEVLKKD